jgi:hypothetical protein
MLTLKEYQSRNHTLVGVLAEGIETLAGNSSFAVGRVEGTTPGSKSASSLTMRIRGNHGEPIVGAGGKAHLLTSLNSEDGGGDDRKSEAPIRAMISGNAEGAKGAPV